jgi:nucleoside-diphosphate-sugar epimerase
MKIVVFGFGYSTGYFVRTRGLFDRVTATVRSADKAAALRNEGVRAVTFAGDEIGPELEAAIDEAEALIVSIPPGEEGDPVLTHFAARICEAKSLSRILYLSTIGIYGDHAGAWVDENTRPRPVSARSRERLLAEQAWEDLGARTGKHVHLLRLAGIYGPGRSGFDKLASGTARRIVKTGQVFNRIHVEDIARSIEAALAYDGRGTAWNVTDDEPAAPQEVMAYAANLMGREPPTEVPFEQADLTLMARSFYGENKRVSNARLKSRLGVQLAFPTYREGLSAIWRAHDA